MTPAEFLARRAPDWQELDSLLARMDYRSDSRLSAADFLRFARLYRAACTDLSLAGAYRLSREAEHRLEDLVSRGHANLYTVRRSRWADVREFFMRKIPFLVYSDPYVRICQIAFWVPFVLCLGLSFRSAPFAEKVVGAATLQSYVEMHAKQRDAHTIGGAVAGSGFYLYNNVSIDLLVFGFGVLGGVGSLLLTLFNAIYLGCIIGYLFASPAGPNLLNFITAHAPFELTAIGISAGAGLRIGFAFVAPAGRHRLRALTEEARHSVPVIVSAAGLTAAAAFLEAFLAPSAVPLLWKALIALVCTLFMFVYFGVGGYLLKRSGYQPPGAKVVASVQEVTG